MAPNSKPEPVVIKPLWWKDCRLYVLDQRKLPGEEKTLELENAGDVCSAIRSLVIRGAPAIGCAAAYGTALAALKDKSRKLATFKRNVSREIRHLAAARPTAYNLFFALGRMERALEAEGRFSVEELKKRLVAEAEAIHGEDLECCLKIGAVGSRLIGDRMRLLTHCNAGGLATSGYGTALSVFYEAKRRGRRFHVFVDETRPVLQGARLTAWELKKTGVPYTLICDSTAGYLMSRGKIDMVITGADRIAANGDTANKIGTYSLAVLADYHGVDFYVAAPFSTFDRSLVNGGGIHVEKRDADEVRMLNGAWVAPRDAPVCNPAFDITPGGLIKGFITEGGIISPPFL